MRSRGVAHAKAVLLSRSACVAVGLAALVASGKPVVGGTGEARLAGRRETAATLAVSIAAARAVCAPDTVALIDRVRKLASPELAGRGNGTPEALAAADSITAWLFTAGAGRLAEAGWFQDFTLEGAAWHGRMARNVVGCLPGAGALAGRWLVAGAHYDHLGRMKDDTTRYFAGADDNASGISVLIELARLLAERAWKSGDGDDRRGVLFVAFAGEEIGLQGSRHFVRNLPVARDSLDAMVNLDTVGRLQAGRLYVGGAGTSPIFEGLLTAANGRHGLDLQVSRGGWDASDHVAFNEVGVPVLFLFTGANEQYHTPDDVWPLVSSEGLARVACFVFDLVKELATRRGPLPYVTVSMGDTTAASTSSPAAAARPSGEAPRRAWFGAIPEFVEGVEGVRLAGVMPDSPAAAAGLARGDILVGFAGQAVSDLGAFTALLRAHEPGDRVEVEFKRGDQVLRCSVVLARRQ